MNGDTAPATSFLAGLEASAIEELRTRAVARSFARGAALFHQDQVSDRAIVVMSGYVKLSSISDDGREVVLAIRGAGDLIGELGALDGQPRSATAITLDEVTVLALSAASFQCFLANHPAVALRVISMLSTRLREADRKLVEFTSRDSLSRVASRVLELSERFGQRFENEVRIELPISQEELAGWTGCSRDSVVKALQAMRSLGWIETRRKQITVHDLEALRQQANGGAPTSEKSGESSTFSEDHAVVQNRPGT
jgi:CRP/FNR family transcriptional regulator, cyclic AMP receptor protein